MTAFMARAAYDFADRYSLTATARIDGSSKFGKNNKWGFFPSLSAAWNIIKEPFLSDVRWLSNLKLRLGYGLAGNQGGIDNYMSMNLFSPTGVVPVGNQAAVSLGTLKNINPDLKWEVKRTFNVGLDAAFWDNRIIGTVDFYTSKTTDMLYMYNVSVPPFSYSKLLDNLGSMRNSGVEVALGITPQAQRGAAHLARRGPRPLAARDRLALSSPRATPRQAQRERICDTRGTMCGTTLGREPATGGASHRGQRH